MRQAIAHTCWLLAAFTLSACSGDAPPASAPASQPATTRAVTTNWPAFSGGGPLRSATSAIAPPPYRVLWQYKTNDVERAAVEGGPAVVDGVVYLPDAYSALHALDAATGAVRWRYTPRGPDNAQAGFSTTPLVHEGTIFIGDSLGVFHAVNASDGSKRWSVDTQSPINAAANMSPDRPDRLVFGNDAAEVHCLATADGKKLWEQKIGDRVNAALSINGGRAYVSGCDAKLRAYDLNDGRELAVADLLALTGGSAAIVAEQNALFVGTDQGRVFSFDVQTLKERWRFEGIEDKAMVYASPAIGSDVMVVGARDRNVHAIELTTGKSRWLFKTRGDVDATPVIAGDLVFVGSKDKKLYVLDLRTGEERWQFQARRGITAPVAVAHTRNGPLIIVGDTAGNVYALTR